MPEHAAHDPDRQHDPDEKGHPHVRHGPAPSLIGGGNRPDAIRVRGSIADRELHWLVEDQPETEADEV